MKNNEIINSSDVTSDIQSYLTSTLKLPQSLTIPGYTSVSLDTTNVKFIVTLNETANTATVTVEYNGNSTASDTATINIDDFYLGSIADSTIAQDIVNNLTKITGTDASTSSDSNLKSIYLINTNASSQIQSDLTNLILANK